MTVLLRTAVLSITALLIVVLGWSRPAMAGGCFPSDQLPLLCGEIGNTSGHRIEVVRNWGSNLDHSDGEDPPAGSTGRAPLDPGGYTPHNQDWDAFKVQRGCHYYWSITTRVIDPLTFIISHTAHLYFSLDLRNAASSRWLRLHDGELVTVYATVCNPPVGQGDPGDAHMEFPPPDDRITDHRPDSTNDSTESRNSCTPRTETHSDPNTGRTWNTVWYCRNSPHVPLYVGAGSSSGVSTAIMDTGTSWFACYARGEYHGGGNNIWYYTKGDRGVDGQESREKWGYMPAVHVWTNTDPFSGIPECQPNVRAFADIDGDGKAERIEIKPNGEVWAWANANGLCGYNCTYTWASIIATGFTDTQNVRFADIDGDGKAEIIQLKANGEVWAWANANGLCGYNCTYTWASIIATGFTDRGRVRFGDIDGDGKAEIIQLKTNGEVWAWANANGLCGYNCTYTWASIIATGFTDTANVHFADLDGDGKAEIIQPASDGNVWTWANANGLCGYNCTYTWASIIAVGFTDRSNVRFADIDGDHRAEIATYLRNGEIRTWANANGLCGYNCTYTWVSILGYL